MSRRITCISRDARKYCEQRTSNGVHTFVSVIGETFVQGEESDDTAFLLYKEVLKDENAWRASEDEPLIFSKVVKKPSRWGPGECSDIAEFWLYKNRIFSESHEEDYTLEQRRLLVLEEFDKERREFERLQGKFSGMPNASQCRTKIPSQVRIFVWQRDGGRCVECNSNENLEYDHIIPFAKGGSNTERNLQLLCGPCNRLKSHNIQ